ncbi:MinD/ParA family protein [Halanaerobium praevalens]|uniref:Cobyrinic acid ac-diamide synthase n=1 Tax=Halanaerobium praevalens (strain ATCC 33744 / DSM 2228 / GSL) TaxID=572479 RepID=E3DPP5_HALPG|nr:MinD/ParA family protein [Halanaerobium praevalens]ADO76720.1 cobyrinic acid ac-diamide synthase [Halanaerobium praevalens DSM 2228]
MRSQAAKLKEIMKKKKAESKVQNFNTVSTRTIAIASGKGGVGKSTFTVNFAYNLRKLDKKVLIIDSDIGMANLDIMLGVQPNYDMGHLLREECSLEEAVIEGPAGIKLLSGITGDDSFIDIKNEAMKKLIELGDKIEKNYDYLLIDLGAGAAKSIVNTILAAEELILLLTTEPTSVMDSYSLIKILSKHQYKKKIKLVINQSQSKKDTDKTAQRIIKTVKNYLDLDLTLVGSISYDRKISEALRKQKPYSEIFSKRKAAQDFENLTRKISGEEKEQSSKGVKSYFYKMVGFFNKHVK